MTGYSSLCGYLPIGDANAIVKEMGEREVLPVTRDTPVIAGVFAADPTREMAHFLRELIDLSFSGVINFPSIAWVEGELRAGLEASGLGFQHEVDMIRIAGEAGLFTLAYVFTPDEAIAMAKAGVDSVVAHMGNTVGGSVGQPHAIALEGAAELTQKIVDAVEGKPRDHRALPRRSHRCSVRPRLHARAHKRRRICRSLKSMERLPVEIAIKSTTKAFKALAVEGRRVPPSP